MQAEFAIRGVSLRRLFPVLAGALLLLVGGAFQSAQAATLCVSQKTHSACQYSTIGAAVSAAAPGDTINVGPGTYQEMVTIGEQLSLVGAGPNVTIIDATGEANAIYVDSTSNVAVTGFTLENAKYEGILVHNSSFVTIWGNKVANNNKNLIPGESASCPGLTDLYPFELNEGADCGEGIHLLGSNHSTVYENTIEYNAGGVLLSDDGAPTDNNSVRNNTIRDNVYDCGVTLPSHGPWGVYDNTIADNYVSGNGVFQPAGAGIGLFAPFGPTKSYGNVIVDNTLVGNGLAGVALHVHAPSIPPANGDEVLEDNLVIGNHFSGNGADTDLSPTEKPNGISLLVVGGTASGLVFSQNTFANESVDIAAKIMAPPLTIAPVTVTVQLNKFQANAVGIENLASGTINATGNWWGCSKGPGGTNGCATISGSGVTSTPWLTNPPNNSGGN